MYYVYFLFLNNQNIYKGITTDLKRRFKAPSDRFSLFWSIGNSADHFGLCRE
jgi:hypothetical protein